MLVLLVHWVNWCHREYSNAACNTGNTCLVSFVVQVPTSPNRLLILSVTIRERIQQSSKSST